MDVTESDNEKVELEDHFILRLPPVEAEYIRSLLRQKPKRIKKRLLIDLNSESGEGKVIVRGKPLKARLLKLPTITESYKTHDGVYMAKTADICHILDCAGEKTLTTNSTDLPHGITPPMKNVKKTRFRKSLINRDESAINVQKELYYLLQADLEAVSTKFELLVSKDSKDTTKTKHRSEIEIFGNVLTDSEAEDSDSEE